jgi:hypothetical protein
MKLTLKFTVETKEIVMDEVAKSLDLNPNRFRSEILQNPPTLLDYTVNESYPVFDNIEGTQKRSISIRLKTFLMVFCIFLYSVLVKRM